MIRIASASCLLVHSNLTMTCSLVGVLDRLGQSRYIRWIDVDEELPGGVGRRWVSCEQRKGCVSGRRREV